MNLYNTKKGFRHDKGKIKWFTNMLFHIRKSTVFPIKSTVVTVDLIGNGSSIETQRGDGIEKTAKYIKNVLIKENIQGVHLVGVSIGAILVQDFANHYPNMVSSLIYFGGYDINNCDTSIQEENGRTQGMMMLKALL